MQPACVMTLCVLLRVAVCCCTCCCVLLCVMKDYILEAHERFMMDNQMRIHPGHSCVHHQV